MFFRKQKIKVTVDLQGCPVKNYSHARRLCYNQRKVYIIVKLIKFRIRRNNLRFDLIWFFFRFGKRARALKRKVDTICSVNWITDLPARTYDQTNCTMLISTWSTTKVCDAFFNISNIFSQLLKIRKYSIR